MKRIEIRDIYLGKASAENESQDLHKYFLPTKAYLNAKDDRKRKLFYIGHRGAGKSALFSQLSHEYSQKRSNIIIQIRPTEYSYETFKNIQHNFYDIKSSYSIAWHYTLIIQIFLEVSKYFSSHKHLKRNRDNLAIIDKYLMENNYRDAETRLEIFLDFLSRINISKVNVKFKGLEIVGQKENSDSKELVKILNMQDLRQPLNALAFITQQHPIFIFIDELDTGWNNSSEAKNFIGGLIYAANKINQMANIHAFLSLRQDMYNNLSETFGDTEKIRDEIELLKWDKNYLRHLISKRIAENKEVRESINRIDNTAHTQILALIFEKGVFDYIVSHTLHRPREVINFCSYALERYVETYQSSDLAGKKITFSVVKEIQEQFSSDRFSDYTSEYTHEFPNIKSFLTKFEGCNSIYSKSEFLTFLETLIFDFLEEFDSDWIKPFLDNPDKLLIKLFDIGFIKISVSDDNDFFAYYEKKPLSYKNVIKIKIHDVFEPALKCVQN